MSEITIKKQIFFLFILFLLILGGCTEDSPVEPQEPQVGERGEIISTSSIGLYTPEVLSALVTFADINLDFEPEVAVNVIKIVYSTIDYNNNRVQASGALFIPQYDTFMPLLSVQHGTVTKRDEVASAGATNSAEGVIGLVAGSIKYIVAVPDYLGYGVSTQLHPYVHADGNTHVVIDFLRAVRTYCQTNNVIISDKLFLTGYSEGGYVTMALHKEIETNYSNEFFPTAVAPMAGPYDLQYTMDDILQKGTYDDPVNIAFFLTAYNHVYQWNRIDEFFNAPFAQSMSNYFGGGFTTTEINNILPNQLDQLLNTEFLTSYQNGTETDFVNAIAENSLLNWAPQAPVKMFHGDADVTVPYQNSVNALSNLQASGAVSIELETIAGGTHGSAGIPAFVGMIEWFEQIRGQ